MKVNSYDVLVPKDFESNKNGTAEKRTSWRKVGNAWPSKSGDAINIEFFMYPNVKYIIQLKNKSESKPQSGEAENE